VAFCIAALGGVAQDTPAPPFHPGETLTYEVMWSIFPAGRVTATLSRVAGDASGAYEVTTSARSQGFVSLIYNVENEFYSRFNPHTLCSERIFKKINEGRRHKDSRLVFDAVRRLAIFEEYDLNQPKAPPKHVESEIPNCVADVVTAFYVVRRHPMAVGNVIHLPINDGAKTYDVGVEVQAREQIETPIGSRLAFRVEPKVFGGLYKRRGRMLIWFSDDEQRLPLRIKASLVFGTITGTLTSVTTTPAGALPDK
jgi:hypothetical protein